MHNGHHTMALLKLAFIFAVAAFLHEASGSVRREGKFCETLSVIGGQTVTIAEAPYMAAVTVKNSATCAGSIVNKQFVLTAASCIGYETAVTVLVGTDKLNAGGHIIDVKKTICHENYDSKTHENDICLLKLEFVVPFDPNVDVIALPSQDYTVGLFNVTGWGSTQSGGILENELHQATVPYVSKECCIKMYNGKYVFSTTQMCAGAYGRDACLGDSGAPLTSNGLQIGIASFGEGCGDNPGVYTKVASFRKWIDDTIAQNE